MMSLRPLKRIPMDAAAGASAIVSASEATAAKATASARVAWRDMVVRR